MLRAATSIIFPQLTIILFQHLIQLTITNNNPWSPLRIIMLIQLRNFHPICRSIPVMDIKVPLHHLNHSI
ncbi:hypothetical protein C1645_749759 [Glomus cerebriforme]|uniref:Uncharacterized protein n=1 Tax=Glomus cerebriforme TaxID=658196 RepID=A0A397TK41_9GLOM|nr:hypothetical protein C1645_749759 [Glomus cerebriforme]